MRFFELTRLAWTRKNSALAYVLAAASICLSAWLTVRFGLSMQLSDSVHVVVALGLVWELAKYLFAAEGWRLVTGFRPREVIAGVGLLLLAAVLTGGSIIATVAATDGVRRGEQRASVRASLESEAATQVRDEIRLLLASAQDDVRLGYRARAERTTARVAVLRDELQELVNSSAGVHEVAAFPLADVAGPAWWVIAVVVGAMLDAISIVSVTLLHATGSSTGNVERKRFDAVKKAIATAKIRPNYREIMGHGEGFAQDEAKQILEECEQAGIVERNGRGWRLA